MASTYDDLITEVRAWLRNTSANDQLANFISQAEDEMNAKLRGVRRIVTATATVDAASATLPTDFQEIRAFRLTNGARLRPMVGVTPERLAELQADDSTPDEPEVFCVQGAAIYFHPPPSQTYSASLVYVGRVPRLSTTNQSNWVLAEFPTAYLNGALWRAYSYLKNAEMASYYGGLFSASLDDLRAASRTMRDQPLRTDFPLIPTRTDFTRA